MSQENKTRCPNCSAEWSWEEIDAQECFYCGYPQVNTPDEDDYEDGYGYPVEDEAYDLATT